MSFFLQTPHTHEFMVFCSTSVVFFHTNEVIYPHILAQDSSLFFHLLYSVNFNKENVGMQKKKNRKKGL